jgi:hypothetical protein
MTDFNRGDQIRITIKDEPEASRTIWLAENDGELITYDGTDPYAPQVPLSVVLEDDGLEVSLEVPFEDALPTVPGSYEDLVRFQDKEFLRSIDPDIDLGEHVDLPWVLNEDGTWTSPDGETRSAEHNWLLVVNGFNFAPWDEVYN